jgi:hypothetical protein
VHLYGFYYKIATVYLKVVEGKGSLSQGYPNPEYERVVATKFCAIDPNIC